MMEQVTFVRKKSLPSILLTIFALLLFTGCSMEQATKGTNGYEVVDSQGTVVKIPDKPKSIMTLSMHTDSIVLGLVKSDRMVAVNTLLDDPASSNIVEKAKRIPNKVRNPSAEEVLALKPDLVIASGWTPADTVATLRDLGLTVFVTPRVTSLADVKASIQYIAQALGEAEKGEQLIGKMDAELAEIKAKVDQIAADERKKVVLISLMTSYGGKGCTYDAMCEYAGVINGIAAAGLENGQALTKEMLVKINPDLLLLPSYRDHGKFDVVAFNDTYLKDPSLQTIAAIKNKNLYYPREGYIYNASQDFVYGVREIAYAAYGEAFAQPSGSHISVSGEE